MIKHIDPDNPNFKYENAVVIKLADLNQYYEECKDTAFIANDFQVTTDKKREELINRLTKTYIDDKFDEPINGNNPLFEKIEPSMWLRPIGKDSIFIMPKFLTILSNALRRDKFDIVRHLLDPSYKPPTTTPKGIVKTYMDANFPRGMKEFHDNFDEIMEVLILEKYRKREEKRNLVGDRRKNVKRSSHDYVAMMIEKYRDIIFCTHLPIPSSHVFVMEKRGRNRSSEVTLMSSVFDAVATVTSMSDRIKPVTKKEADRLDYKINFTCMATFYEVYGSGYLKSKSGHFRRCSYGTSTSFNCRAVIVSRHGVHRYDQIEISYALGFKMMELHIGKKFIDMQDYTPLDVFELRANYARQFNKDAHDIMEELIQDFWGGDGWGSAVLRHPYLSTLSYQYLPIGGVGKDPLNYTFGLSPLVLAGFNADFDGDEMFIKLMLDKYSADLWQTMKPHYSALDANTPYAYSKDLNLPKPIIPNFHRWLGYDAT